MHSQTTFQLLDSVPVPMRDGTILRADVWLPGGKGPAWPVLLQRTPYRKEEVFGAQYISGLEFQSALRQGFAVMVQDTRGRYSSEGDFYPFVHEANDGVDTMSWLLQQTFCDGRVQMFGASYVGATQVLLAAQNPSGLMGIAPHLTTARHGDTWMFKGGAIELGLVMLWLTQSLGIEDLNHRRAALDASATARAAELLASFVRDPAAAFARLPILDEALRELAPYMAHWLAPPHIVPGGGDQGTVAKLKECAASMLVIAGWNDVFIEGSIELFEIALSRHLAGKPVRDRLIVGPWSHGNPLDWQGDEWLGYGASTADVSAAQLEFFEDTLSRPNPSTPLVRYFRSGSNTWHAADSWPLADRESLALHLTGDGQLAYEPATSEWSRAYISDPNNPVPTVGGASFLPGLLLGRNSGPKDQMPIEARTDVLVFTSPPLAADLDVTGLVEAHLFVESSAPTCDWTAKLCEVDSSGRSLSRVDGILRWNRPSSQTMSGSASEITVRLGHVSHLFRKGHRVRLQIASANFPRFDRNPQSGTASTLATSADLRIAHQTVWGGGGYGSRLILPGVRSTSSGVASLGLAAL